MTDPASNLPEALETLPAGTLEGAGLPGLSMEMSPALAVFFNDALYRRCRQVAQIMAAAEGVTPAHLVGKPAACFMVVSRAIVWKMDPMAVAMCTYQTPGGGIGFEGKLVQAILENSGQVVGQIKFDLAGDWSRVRGKFKMATSQKNKEYPVHDWAPEAEEGLSVTVSCQIKGEAERREETFFLSTFWPRHSTLWALRPEQQIKYAAVRAFANTVTPSLLLGAPFDVDPISVAQPMVDITPPRPQPEGEFRRALSDVPELGEFISQANFAGSLNELGRIRAEGLAKLPESVHARFNEVCDGRARDFERAAQRRPDDVEEAVVDDSKHENQPAAKPGAETPLERGKRLLAGLDDPRDIDGLFDTIVQEVKDDPAKVKEWQEACDVREKELTTPAAGKNGRKTTKK